MNQEESVQPTHIPFAEKLFEIEALGHPVPFLFPLFRRPFRPTIITREAAELLTKDLEGLPIIERPVAAGVVSGCAIAEKDPVTGVVSGGEIIDNFFWVKGFVWGEQAMTRSSSFRLSIEASIESREESGQENALIVTKILLPRRLILNWLYFKLPQEI